MSFHRLSPRAVKVLFGAVTGFEVVEAGMFNRMDIHPEDRQASYARMPLILGWGGAYVLARKVRHLPNGTVCWPLAPDDLEKRSQEYPEH
jgi:hypothetical protein